jgi:GntR family transcriptional regulator, transcriptional repressor for pyruvate dehydrogenase complex
VGVADQAILKIKGMIMAGQLRPGDRLPPEPELAAQIGVSRSSLREAVRALALIQVLDVRRGDGTYVTSLEPAMLMESTGFIVELLAGGRELDFYQLRRILEPAAAALAVARIDAATLDELHTLLLRMEAATTVPEVAEADVAFHRTITAAAGNDLLTSLLDNLSSETIRVRIWHLITGTDVAEVTKVEHRFIYDAIRARDPDLVRASVSMHIARGEARLQHLLAEDMSAASVAGRRPVLVS